MRKYNLNIISEEVVPLNKKITELVISDLDEDVSLNELKLTFAQKNQFKLVGYIAAFMFVLALFMMGDHLLEDYWIFLIIFLVSVLFLYMGYRIPEKFWMLNRLKQEVAIPLSLKRKPRVKSIYDVKSGYYVQSGGTTGLNVLIPVVWHESRLPFCNTSILSTWKDIQNNDKGDAARTWSFYIWYLDKNRPLPPGDLLDPFREADFQRRKKEGFPPPLFCSCIPTPEATAQQQEERDKYWKDEDYIFRLDRYREPSMWGGFKGKGDTSLRLEKDAVLIHQRNVPEGWTKKPYPEFENFKYLPTAYAMRYEYQDGRVLYSYINQNNEEVYTPPEEDVYKKEIIR